jgi:hypothetical protein
MNYFVISSNHQKNIPFETIETISEHKCSKIPHKNIIHELSNEKELLIIKSQ